MKKSSTGRSDQGVSVTSDLRLPGHVFDVVVEALADALVLDYQEDEGAMVNSPRGKDHESGMTPT